MPTTFLDLDTIRKPIGTFQLGGTQYQIWPLRIRQLINAQAAPADGAAAQAHEIRQLVEMLIDAIPDCPREALEGLDVVQLNALTAYVQTAGQDDAQKNSAPRPGTPKRLKTGSGT